VKYAITNNVKVTATSVSGAVLNLNPVSARVVLPGSVVQGATYTVMANLSSAGGRAVTALQSSWYLAPPQTTTLAPYVNNPAATSYSTFHYFTAPITGGAPTSLFFQGVFTAKSTLLKADEQATQWIYNCPEVNMPVVATTNLTIVAPDF